MPITSAAHYNRIYSTLDWYLFVDYCVPAATADKVTAALADPAASDMKLEDLEAHLNSLKAMFIEKQKMMDTMNKAA